ncbi:hypothetical protein [Actinocatenispora rupis]|uniref:Uncharacterized protein n=1 Tax=Actinocatenispora rupis TaxID=519421 RepID=A0A8J3J5A8_9ACTN|nr:hypothetical protein [Actinocatenispora rupis]GID14393.1 hypothetical protein Aru02nite_52820 [Actinocatenispora rupis]
MRMPWKREDRNDREGHGEPEVRGGRTDRGDRPARGEREPLGVDERFYEGGESRRGGSMRVGRPVQEALSDDAGPSSPFGAVTLPLPPEDVAYELPDDGPPSEHPVHTEL